MTTGDKRFDAEISRMRRLENSHDGLMNMLETSAVQLDLVAGQLRLAFANNPNATEAFHDLVTATESQARKARIAVNKAAEIRKEMQS